MKLLSSSLTTVGSPRGILDARIEYVTKPIPATFPNLFANKLNEWDDTVADAVKPRPMAEMTTTRAIKRDDQFKLETIFALNVQFAYKTRLTGSMIIAQKVDIAVIVTLKPRLALKRLHHLHKQTLEN